MLRRRISSRLDMSRAAGTQVGSPDAVAVD